MNKSVEKILKQALKTPSEDRATIAERLITSLDIEEDVDVEVAWQNEVQHRIIEVDNGKVLCIPWETVKQH